MLGARQNVQNDETFSTTEVNGKVSWDFCEAILWVISGLCPSTELFHKVLAFVLQGTKCSNPHLKDDYEKNQIDSGWLIIPEYSLALRRTMMVVLIIWLAQTENNTAKYSIGGQIFQFFQWTWYLLTKFCKAELVKQQTLCLKNIIWRWNMERRKFFLWRK